MCGKVCQRKPLLNRLRDSFSAAEQVLLGSDAEKWPRNVAPTRTPGALHLLRGIRVARQPVFGMRSTPVGLSGADLY